MAIINYNQKKLETIVKPSIVSAKRHLSNAISSASSLSIPEGFNNSEYLSSLADKLNDVCNDYTKIVKWIETSVNNFENVSTEFENDFSSFVPIEIKEDDVKISTYAN